MAIAIGTIFVDAWSRGRFLEVFIYFPRKDGEPSPNRILTKGVTICSAETPDPPAPTPRAFRTNLLDPYDDYLLE